MIMLGGRGGGDRGGRGGFGGTLESSFDLI